MSKAGLKARVQREMRKLAEDGLAKHKEMLQTLVTPTLPHVGLT